MVPSKVNAFLWTMVCNIININYMLRTHRPNKVLSPDLCIILICFRSLDINSHINLHFEVARSIWIELFVLNFLFPIFCILFSSKKNTRFVDLGCESNIYSIVDALFLVASQIPCKKKMLWPV